MKRKKIAKKIERKDAKAEAKNLAKSSRPRISVFRSNKHIYAQIIDDEKGETLVAASDKDLSLDEKHLDAKARKKSRVKDMDKGSSASRKSSVTSAVSKTDIAKIVGEVLAKKALRKKITKVTFDRRNYRYHGRVRALAEGARRGGLEF